MAGAEGGDESDPTEEDGYGLEEEGDDGEAQTHQVRPSLKITPIFPDFSRFLPIFPWTSGRALWIPGVQTLKMGEKWEKMGKKWVKNEVTG